MERINKNGIINGTMIVGNSAKIHKDDIVINPNLLIHAEKCLTPYTVTSELKDGYKHIGVYFNNLVVGNKYTISCEFDGNIAINHGQTSTPNEKNCSIWLYFQNNQYTDLSYTTYASPWCFLKNNYSHKQKGTFHEWTFTAPYQCCSVRFNTYSDGVSPTTVNFWNIKLEEGSKATPWTPNSQDELFDKLNYSSNIKYKKPIEANDFYEI